MKSFLAGLGIGIGVGLLFAPLRGEEARERISKRSRDLADSARRHAGDWAESALDFVDEGRERMRTTVSKMRKKAEEMGQQPTGTSHDL